MQPKMKLVPLLILSCTLVSSTPSHLQASIPTVFLAGDSTEAPGGGGSGTEGWGQYLHYSLNASRIYVNNSAIAGRSARSYTREGRFNAIARSLKKGDWVVIEFGHNDGGSPYPAASDNGRSDCPGAGSLLMLSYSLNNAQFSLSRQ